MIYFAVLISLFCWLFVIKLTINPTIEHNKEKIELIAKSLFYWLAVISAFIAGVML